MKLNKRGIPIIFIAAIVTITSISVILTEEFKGFNGDAGVKSQVWKLPEEKQGIEDNPNAYYGEETELKDLYITILPPQSHNGVTFSELNSNINITNEVYSNDTEDIVADIIVGEYPVDENQNLISNGTIEIRGQSSRTAPQKSYKIKINDDVKVENGNYIVNLNKHYNDNSRIRNKIAFDLIKKLDNITSFRTEFVNLYVKDLSVNSSGDYKPYGLFTSIEQPNKTYLKNHGLDPQGHFYKAEFFEFYRYEDNIKVKNDPEYEYNKFESIIETRGNDEHEGIIEMLEAVNDYSKNINEVVQQYFDKENMLTWVAMNILLGNLDTSSRNYLLYNSLNSDKWYFLPWDYDSSLYDDYDMESFQTGIANTWGMVLFNRFFRESENVEALSDKIEELYKVINEEAIINLVESYDKKIYEVMHSYPDSEGLKYSTGTYSDLISNMTKIPELNRERYYQDIQRPLPFFLGEVVTNETTSFIWQNSFDFQGDEITYDILISTDGDFKNIVAKEENLKEVTFEVNLEPGKYYWRVIAKDEKGNWRYAFDELREDGIGYLGVRTFIVE